MAKSIQNIIKEKVTPVLNVTLSLNKGTFTVYKKNSFDEGLNSDE